MKKRFNICLIQPNNYIHSYAFLELGQLLDFGIKELGFASKLSINKVCKDSTNVIIGVHLLNAALLPQIPLNSIILNTEQLEGIQKSWLESILNFSKNFAVWDYSLKNISKLAGLGFMDVKYLELGYQKEMYRIPKCSTQDIDVLFYGSMNPRREKVISQLKSRNLNINVAFGIYGPQRDELISNSKIVLNLHYYESQIYEVVRSSYLLNNAKLVVGEVNETTSIENRYLEAIFPAKYEDLADSCHELAVNETLRKNLEDRAISSFMKYSQAELLSKIL
jgi:hypothetical protein